MKFYVFQSLRPNDPKTGEAIYDYLFQQRQQSHFFNFSSRTQLFEQLVLVALDASLQQVQAFVHLDCHGNEDGIGIVETSGHEDFVSWDELRPYFRTIHLKSGKRAVLCMSSCEGFNAIKLVPQSHPCPYDFVAGSFEKISFKMSIDGYKLFYGQVLRGNSNYVAALHVHNDSALKPMKFIGLSANTLLDFAVNAFIERECTPVRLAERKEEIRDELLKMQNSLTSDQIQALDNTFSSIEGQQPYVDRLRQVFYS